MEFRHATDKETALIHAINDYNSGAAPTLRAAVEKHGVSYSAVQRAVKAGIKTLPDLFQRADGRGRRPRLTSSEERLIADVALEFQSNGTPLSKSCLRALAKTLVETFPDSRQKSLGFKDNRPGEDWIGYFLRRNARLTVKKRANLEFTRAEAMNPEAVSVHFARMACLCEKYSVRDGQHVFNVDESGLSLRGMDLGGKEKCIVGAGSRPNTRELKFSGLLDHLSFMPVTNAVGGIFTPLVVLQGIQAKYRRRAGSQQYETTADYLPSPCHLFMRPIAGVDTDIFYEWAKLFVEETAYLRRGGQHLLLVLDGYSGHLQYKTLKYLKENNIIVMGLPAHTSHVLQPLDVGVFGPFKEAFRQLLGLRTITTTRDSRNDVFSVCEIFREAYHRTVIPSNIIAGFRRSGLWVQSKKGCDPSQIRPTDLTSSEVRCGALGTSTVITRSASLASAAGASDDVTVCGHARIERMKQLYDLFLKKSEQLVSDGTIIENGSIKVTTRTGATLTSHNVLAALKKRDEDKDATEQRRQSNLERRAQRKSDELAANAAKEQARVARKSKRDDAEETELQKVKARRARARSAMKESRKVRRDRAKLRSRLTASSTEAC